MILRAARYLTSSLGERFRFAITRPARFLLAGAVTATLIGSLTLELPVYHLFTALICTLLLAFFVNLLFRPRLKVRGTFPAKATANHPVIGHFEITNRGPLPAYDIGAGFFKANPRIVPESTAPRIPRIGRGEKATIDLQITPLRRGVYHLGPLRAYSSFPLGLWRGGARKSPATVLVRPDFHPLQKVDVPVGSRHQPGGIVLTSNVGESPEYIGNRDYRPGDSTRRIDSRAWARLAAPAVKEYQQEYYCRLAMVCDTFIPLRSHIKAQPFQQLEAAISLTAALADAMSNGEYIIDIFAAGPDLYVFRSGRHTAPLENVLEILACVEACKQNPFETIAPALSEELGNISTTVFIFLDWDSTRRDLVQSAIEAGSLVKVIIVRGGPTSEPCVESRGWCSPPLLVTPKQVREGKVVHL